MRGGAALLALALWAAPIRAQTAWIPEPGHGDAGVTYSVERFRKFWLGTHEAELPGTRTQETTLVRAEVGLARDLALDLSAGYTHTSLQDTSDHGLADTLVGLRWRLVDEFRADHSPTLAVRLGAIVQGTYHTGFVAAPGDSASGVELSLLAAKSVLGTGFAVDGGLGYRRRAEGVPADVFGSIEALKTLRDVTFGVSYQHDQALSGPDIGGPGFTEARFPEIKEIWGVVAVGVTWRPTRAASIGGSYGRTVLGRNTAERPVAVLSIGYAF